MNFHEMKQIDFLFCRAINNTCRLSKINLDLLNTIQALKSYKNTFLVLYGRLKLPWMTTSDEMGKVL